MALRSVPMLLPAGLLLSGCASLLTNYAGDCPAPTAEGAAFVTRMMTANEENIRRAERGLQTLAEESIRPLRSESPADQRVCARMRNEGFAISSSTQQHEYYAAGPYYVAVYRPNIAFGWDDLSVVDQNMKPPRRVVSYVPLAKPYD